MKQRVISVAVLLAVVIACLPWMYSRVGIFCIAGILCAWEYAQCLREKGISITRWVLLTYMLMMYFLTVTRCGLMTYIAWFCVAIFLSLFSGILHRDVSGQGAVYTVSALSYPCFPFALLMIISVSDRWLQTLGLACFSTWLCDAFALFGGKWWGKHKIAPDVSPNKTVEGCITGAAASLLGGVLVFFLSKMFDSPLPLWLCLITAFVSSTLGQIGDLAESLLKRYLGVKDFSDLIPGHGGMFDRADSLIFSIPTAYFCLYLFGF